MFRVSKENHSRKEVGAKELQTKWQKPLVGRCKVNSDATCFKEGCVGFGEIMRNVEGDVMVATFNQFGGSFTAEEAEAMAARHALSIAVEVGLMRLVLECDCLKLITHLKEGKRENSSFGNIVLDIIEIGKTCSSLDFSHVCRGGGVM